MFISFVYILCFSITLSVNWLTFPNIKRTYQNNIFITMPIINFLFQFGIAGLFLFLCIFIVLSITIERFIFFFVVASKNNDRFLAGLLKMLNDSKAQPKELREVYIQQSLDYINATFARGLLVIKFISIAAPMLGLVGTILGMISIFDDISATNAPVTPMLISSGLKEALYTTAMGLFIAIPSLGLNIFFHHIIDVRTQQYIHIVNEKTVQSR